MSDLIKHTTPVRIRINGKAYEGEIAPRMLLVEFIREHAKLTGTHIGCDTSFCGACTVLMNGMAVKSCTLFAVQADGLDILTVEGLADAGDLHPLQQAFSEHHGLQCGYCTPGMLLSSLALLAENPNPSTADIKKALAGNLCRCTGYQNIITSVKAAAQGLREGQT